VTHVIGLVATFPRVDALLTTSIPSIAEQSRLPDALVIVSDQTRLPTDVRQALRALIPTIEVHFLENTHATGLAGSWNTGLAFIQGAWPDPYVAILDDDDQWDAEHLALCLSTAEREAWPDVVISGLRIRVEGREIQRPLLQALATDDFLIGNPGWQGSNTFATATKLVAAGGFRESLVSCHDRDLAIRMLDLPETRISFTGRNTATWNMNTYPNTLSRPGPQKADALRHFLALHGHRMSLEIRQRFMSRCFELFSLTAEELQ
jgi:glycosyltransferase involved in cell wall biosynthesis